MFWNAAGGSVRIEDTSMDYVTFGTGDAPLVMIPGLGDGLTTVKGMAAAMAFSYRMYAKDYKVYIFSRKNNLEKYQQLKTEYSTREMAKELAFALKTLGIKRAKVLGVSQGGMIAQYLAIDHPALVDRLVLAVTLSRQNATVRTVVTDWIQFARQGDHKALMIDIAEKSYSEAYLKKYRRLYPVLCKIGKPKDFGRFLTQAGACTNHDAYDLLDRISCPTLVVGGCCDKIVGADASVELAGKIKDSELYLYEGLGHAAYEEAHDFNRRVMDFFGRESIPSLTAAPPPWQPPAR